MEDTAEKVEPSGEEIRRAFLEEVRQRLTGPSAPEEALQEKPNKRYLTGMLFPRGASTGGAIADEEELQDDESEDEDSPELESPMDLLFQRLPASVGLTFALAADEKKLRVSVSGGRYERGLPEVLAEGGPEEAPLRKRGGSGWVWKRRPLPAQDSEESVEFPVTIGRHKKLVFDGRASVQLFVRPAQGVPIATVSLVNERQAEEDTPVEVEDILFQIAMRCSPERGVPAYPDAPSISMDPEAEELALQYRSRPTHAVGHGCSAAWLPARGEAVDWVAIDHVPSVEVPPVTTRIDGLSVEAEAALSMVNLQSEQFDPGPGIRSLIGAYKTWRNTLQGTTVPARFDVPKGRVVARLDAIISRLDDGADLLARDALALRVFRQANRAMLLSLARTAANENRGPSAPFLDIDISALEQGSFTWRPFQLAFFLISLRGLWNPDHHDRSVVDLIWFPTGGGKTEAYLAVAAFEMIRRRLVEGDLGAGTAVIKRYTLRLLTIQQFERAGSLICSLETLRKAGAIRGAPFSLGLWVGQDSSPNSDREAVADLEKILSTVGRVEGTRMPLKRCPVCATPVVPPSKNEGSDGVGLRQEGGRVKVFCPNVDCPFHDGLPIAYVDERLYESPPTMLLGTVDKFAMLAWRDVARAFFGIGRNCAPPSLVIQDELHLIAGPLGTIAGIYEAAIDTVIAKLGRPAKYICATATIRRADDQIRKLYGRSAALFPPPGLDATDSFFSRAQTDKAGRLYVGAMGQGHTPTFSNVIVSTALLAAGGVAREKYQDKADTYWTLVAYHNSKRELGKTLSLARDDVPARLRALGENRQLKANGVKELSANLRDSEIPEALHHLSVGLPDSATLDFVACTNMLSVGVDVKRLGLMLVNGQPKTVSEYIQASSRVGRDSGRPPGIVLALFSPSKPRDRSHYEFFRSFHPAYYRHVEPTSVTPFALPAQDRGLHGAFLALVRMVSNLHDNRHASRITSAENEVRALASDFLRRVAAAADGDPAESAACLDRFIGDWSDRAARWGANLRFQSGGRQNHPLIKPFRSPGEGWETLQSLRHVDTPLRLVVPMQQAGDAGSAAGVVQR